MKYEEARNLIGNIVENEFEHVQEYKEREFLDTDKEQIKLNKGSEKLYKQLLENVPKEYRSLLDDYIDVASYELINMCRFYFKEGIRAGVGNLNFVKEIDGIKADYIL